MQLPTEIYDLIIFYVENLGTTSLHFGRDDAQHYNLRGYESRRWLASLRLVSKAFCDSASPQLFRHVVTKLYSPSTVSRLVRLMALSKSRYANYVRQIDFGFHSRRSYNRSGCVGSVVDMEVLAGMLSSCLLRFTNLKALTFHEPPSYLSREETKIYIDTVTVAFRHVPLPNLEELEIHFPITHDFGQFFPLKTSAVEIPITDVLQRLRRLELFVCAHTDPRHQRYRAPAILPEHAALPNEDYASSLFKLIEPAINLKSLSIHSLDILNLDTARFSPLLRLRFLSLTGVSISAHNLLSLVVQFRDSLRFIELVRVNLNTKAWYNVLLEISKLPSLLDFHIDSSGYSSSGATFHLVPGLRPAADGSSSIKSRESKDILALGNVQRAVNANRVKTGIPPFPHSDYRFLEKHPLETELQKLDLGSGS